MKNREGEFYDLQRNSSGNILSYLFVRLGDSTNEGGSDKRVIRAF